MPLAVAVTVAAPFAARSIGPRRVQTRVLQDPSQVAWVLECPRELHAAPAWSCCCCYCCFGRSDPWTLQYCTAARDRSRTRTGSSGSSPQPDNLRLIGWEERSSQAPAQGRSSTARNTRGGHEKMQAQTRIHLSRLLEQRRSPGAAGERGAGRVPSAILPALPTRSPRRPPPPRCHRVLGVHCRSAELFVTRACARVTRPGGRLDPFRWRTWPSTRGPSRRGARGLFYKSARSRARAGRPGWRP